MSLKPPIPGLRRIHYDGVSPGKASIIVQPDDVLDVSDDVAAQLLAASGQFKTAGPADRSEPPAPSPVDELVEADAPDPDLEQTPPPTAAAKPPRKRQARKSAAKKP